MGERGAPITKYFKVQKATETAKSVETTKAVKTLTAMATLTGIGDGAKSRKKITATKPKDKKMQPSFYFTAKFSVLSVIDPKHAHLIGRESFASNLFGEQDEIKEAFDAIKAGKAVTAYIYSDVNGDVLLRLRPTKLTKRDFASMSTDDVATLDNVSAKSRKYINVIDDADLDDDKI